MLPVLRDYLLIDGVGVAGRGHVRDEVLAVHQPGDAGEQPDVDARGPRGARRSLLSSHGIHHRLTLPHSIHRRIATAAEYRVYPASEVDGLHASATA